MRTRPYYFGIWILAIALAAAGSYAAETDAERHARIERLIEQLASPNEKPIPGDRGDVIFPEKYDRKAQVKVVEAWKALLKEGYHAFPQLLAHHNDERYCCTVRAPADQRNINVGQVCGSIVYSNIEPYNLESMGRGGGLDGGIRGSLEEWLLARKGKSLREMQIERAEDAVKQLQQRRGEGYIEEARRKNIATLTKLIADLKTRKDALIPDGKVAHVLGL